MPLKRSALFLLLSGAACASGRVTPEGACRSRLLAIAARPNAEDLAKLAGTYELSLVNADGEYGDSVSHGRLTLWANDSVRRYAWVTPSIGRIPGERPLTGTFASRSATVPSYPNLWEPAGPDRPAVELIGPTLYFGGIDAMDGGGERLEITAISGAGFGGTWTFDGGIAMTIDTATGRRIRDPGGYFCAVRVSAT
jgi:hypothetical protein